MTDTEIVASATADAAIPFSINRSARMYDMPLKLPQLGTRIFLTDGGLETTLVFHEQMELPHFAAFDLLRTTEGRQTLVEYFERYIAIAKADDAGFILESPTWRASPDWGVKLGYSREAIAEVNRQSIVLLRRLAAIHASPRTPIVVSGCVGPRGDGYDPGQIMSPEAAQDYHDVQISAFSASGADMTTAITMTNVPETIGIVRCARGRRLPVAVSFTVETDGRLPTGHSLGEAIDVVDQSTDGYAAYYMINCAHPTHFDEALQSDARWTKRIRGIRANASKRSHQELNDSSDLDDGDPHELADAYRELLARLPHITVLGGCCGTDHRHVSSISRACRAAH